MDTIINKLTAVAALGIGYILGTSFRKKEALRKSDLDEQNVDIIIREGDTLSSLCPEKKTYKSKAPWKYAELSDTPTHVFMYYPHRTTNRVETLTVSKHWNGVNGEQQNQMILQPVDSKIIPEGMKIHVILCPYMSEAEPKPYLNVEMLSTEIMTSPQKLEDEKAIQEQKAIQEALEEAQRKLDQALPVAQIYVENVASADPQSKEVSTEFGNLEMAPLVTAESVAEPTLLDIQPNEVPVVHNEVNDVVNDTLDHITEHTEHSVVLMAKIKHEETNSVNNLETNSVNNLETKTASSST